MAFTQNTFASVGAHSANTPNLYSYKSDDTFNEVTVAGYFLPKINQLETGDFLIAQLSDYSGLLEVDETNSGVVPVNEPLNKTAYGDLATAESTPAVQVSAQYGLLENVISLNGPSGTSVEVNSKFSTSSGVNANGFGSISTKDRLTFRPGEGEKDIFTARFSAGAVSSEQFAGAVNPTDGYGFGYNGIDFGILYRSRGALEIQELTITTPAGGSENANITIDGTPYTVPLTIGTVQHNALEIADSLNAQVPLWQFTSNDDQVVAASVLATDISGSFSFSSATAIAAFAQVSNGVLPIDTWVNKADWNTFNAPDLDPSKINNYKIQIGLGSVRFFAANSATHAFDMVHIIEFNNSGLNPPNSLFTFGHTWYALNRGGTTDVVTEGSYCGLFREGAEIDLASTQSGQNTVAGITTIIPLITIRSRLVIDDSANLGRLCVTGVSVTTDSTKAVIITLIRNADITAEVFEYQNKVTSIAEVDTSAATVTGQGVALTGLGSLSFGDLDINLRRGERLTIAAEVTSGAASEFTVTVAWEEEL